MKFGMLNDERCFYVPDGNGKLKKGAVTDDDLQSALIKLGEINRNQETPLEVRLKIQEAMESIAMSISKNGFVEYK